MIRGKEPILDEYGLGRSSDQAVAILESADLPAPADIEAFCNEFDVQPETVIICIASTRSIPGTLQVVARSVENRAAQIARDRI